jgi:hypothetical protein
MEYPYGLKDAEVEYNLLAVINEPRKYHLNNSRLLNAPTPDPSPKSGRGDIKCGFFARPRAKKPRKKIFPRLGAGGRGVGKSVYRDFLRSYLFRGFSTACRRKTAFNNLPFLPRGGRGRGMEGFTQFLRGWSTNEKFGQTHASTFSCEI